MSSTRNRTRLPRTSATRIAAEAAATGAALVTPAHLFESFLAEDSIDRLTVALARGRDAAHPDEEEYLGLLDAARAGDGSALTRLEFVWMDRMLCATEIGFLAGLGAARGGAR